MKHTLLIITALMLVVGCSSPEPINYEETLNKRDGVWYNNHNEPYSGEVFSLYEVGVMQDEGYLKNGKRDGEWIIYKWGQKVEEREYKNGKKDGKWTYFEDDPPFHMTGKGFFKDGKPVGKWTKYNKDGSVEEVQEF